jgi:hypothetical protein
MRRAAGASAASGGMVLRSWGAACAAVPGLSFGEFYPVAPAACANLPGRPAAARLRVVRPPAPRPFDPWRFRAQFPDLWSAFLRARYRRPEEVAVAFAVSEKAARLWWDGASGAQGDKVVVALRLHGPAAVMEAMGIGPAAGVAA